MGWTKKYKEPQTELVMFDPAEATNTVLMSVLERYHTVDGFDNTLSRILIERKRQREAASQEDK